MPLKIRITAGFPMLDNFIYSRLTLISGAFSPGLRDVYSIGTYSCKTMAAFNRANSITAFIVLNSVSE
jgi:hypothetical protein